MPKHIVMTLVVTIVFFTSLWVAIMVLHQSPGRATLAGILTALLIGVGVNFSWSTLRRNDSA